MSESLVLLILIVIVVVLIIILIQLVLKVLKKPTKRETISSLKCIDGHVVRSKGELIIDNYLRQHSIQHEYEETIKVRGKPIKYDWYLPKYKLYIEYWGFFGKQYEKRKEEKLKLYRKGKLKLISIENIMFKDIYSNLEHELKKYIKLDKLDKKGKHCPRCGVKLDERF